MGKNAFMIAICGRSGTGKTSFARLISKILGKENVAIVCLDDYHKYGREERKRLGITPLNPEANKIELIEEHLQKMKNMESFQKPIYDHSQGKVVENGEVFEPKPIVIVEGLLPLYTEKMRSVFDLSIFIEISRELWLKWKLQRDMMERGYKKEFDLAERDKDYKHYIQPQKNFADLVIKVKEKKNSFQSKIKFLKPGGINKSIRLPLKLFALSNPMIPKYSLKVENGKVKLEGNFPKSIVYDEMLREKIDKELLDSFLMAQLLTIDYIIEKVKYN